MDLTITKGNVQDIDVAVNSTSVTVQQANSVLVEVTPQQRIEINLDRTVTGNGIPSGGTTGQALVKASNANYDAIWASIGNGTVTSVAFSGGTTGLTATGSPITTSGTITLNGILNVLNGGTGASTASGARANLQAAQSGANTDITSLGGITGGIQTADFLQLDTAAATAIALGKLRWNTATATAAFGIVDGTDEVNIGEQMFAFVTNAESFAITRGQAVYLYQASGDRASVKLASNLGDATSAKTLGLVAQNSIGANQTGFVITQGQLSKLNMSAFSQGDTLYLGATAGSLTNIKPQAPNHLVYIGVVERANAGNGQMYVKPQNGYELDELHNVQINSPVNGQTIIYDQSTSLWKNANLTAGTGVTITNGNGSITISAPENGTVTSVSGTGAVSGITLSGTVTSSGSLTLGGALDLSSPPAIGNTTPNTGRFTTLQTTGQVDFYSTPASNPFLVRLNTNGQTNGYAEFAVTDGTRFGEIGLAVTSTSSYGDANEVYFRGSGQTVGTVISSASASTPRIRFITGASGSSTEQFRVTNTASAVNYVQVTGAATAGTPVISAQGSDTNVGIAYNTKGTATHTFQTNGTTRLQVNATGGVNMGFNNGVAALQVAGATSQVNSFSLVGSATNLEPVISVLGSDTNISMGLQSKGTGAIDLVAGSDGVNISNGGTVTAVTRTGAGTGYTTPPTVAISAPTTAGGVQATATVTIGLVSVTSIANGGTGYTVGNTLTVSGGTFTTACQVTVTTVSGGVITGVSVTTGGSYTVAPTNPVSVTGGSGSGATFNLSFGITTSFTITNAGSGYIEQPNVTFSGGGGSGASAYARIGNDTTIKGLGLNQLFATSGGVNFAVLDCGLQNPATYGALTGGSASAGFIPVSSNANAGVTFTSKGTSPLDFYTNSYGSLALRASHTASAVNYVQVTGGATTNLPVISAQGSDTNVGLELRTKGAPTGPGFRVTNNNGSNVCFAITTSVANPANYMRADPAAAGSATGMSAQGSDTNIDLSLTTKGTGAVRFNTGNGLFFAVTDAGAASSNYWTATANVVGNPILRTIGTGANAFIDNGSANAIVFRTNGAIAGVEQFRVSHTASAVNYVQATGGATTAAPVISAQGSDTNISLTFNKKGTGNFQFVGPVVLGSSGANFMQIVGAGAGSAPAISAQGSDTNINFTIQPKGTGRVQFGTHTATTDTAISGYIEILDAGGTLRKLAVIT